MTAFSVPSMLTKEQAVEMRVMAQRGKDENLRFSSANLFGELTVLDSGRVRSALPEGIGHAKAFGCGLLLVRRVD